VADYLITADPTPRQPVGSSDAEALILGWQKMNVPFALFGVIGL
jgi:hypothetical protein